MTGVHPVFVDAGVLLAHVSGVPTDGVALAQRVVGEGRPLLLTDVVVAEFVDVLEFDIGAERHLVATVARSLLTSERVVTADPDVLLRALALYELDGLRFRDAHLIAVAESTGVDVAAVSPGVAQHAVAD